MNCKNCKTEIKKESKFCSNCGKGIKLPFFKKMPLTTVSVSLLIIIPIAFILLPWNFDFISPFYFGMGMGFLILICILLDLNKLQKSNNIEGEKSKTDIVKVKKILKSTGIFIYIIAWFTIVVNVGIYVWTILDKSFFKYGLPRGNFATVFLVVAAMVVFIILGKRIKKGVDKKIKLYLQIILGLSLAFVLFIFISGGIVGLLFFLFILYVLQCLMIVNKAMKTEEFTSTLISPEHKLNKNGWKIYVGVSALIFIISISVNLPGQKASKIKQLVEMTKITKKLPEKLDEVITWDNIVAEPSAIRYEYTVTEEGAKNMSDSSVKKNLISVACEDKDSKSFLNEGINLEYLFNVSNTRQSFFASVTKKDCP